MKSKFKVGDILVFKGKRKKIKIIDYYYIVSKIEVEDRENKNLINKYLIELENRNLSTNYGNPDKKDNYILSLVNKNLRKATKKEKDMILLNQI